MYSLVLGIRDVKIHHKIKKSPTEIPKSPLKIKRSQSRERSKSATKMANWMQKENGVNHLS